MIPARIAGMKRWELAPDVPEKERVSVLQWQAVHHAIRTSFPNNWRSYVNKLRWHPLEGCYSFIAMGMFVGVELDGYIHT